MKDWQSFVSLVVSLIAVGSLTWFHGVDAHSNTPHLGILGVCFGFYFAQFAYRSHRHGWREYANSNRAETALFVVMFTSLGLWLAGVPVARSIGIALGMGHDANILLVHVGLLLFAGLELAQAVGRTTIWRLSPPSLLLLSFGVMVSVGAALLLLPEMSTRHISFIDALFTSVSASCVTGLAVVDTATFFTPKGQLVILALIEVGGLNIILFATFFILGYEQVPTTPVQDARMRELLGANELSKERVSILFGKIAATAIPVQLAGAIALSLASDSSAFHAVFHSISAFNNAGFTVTSLDTGPIALTVITVLVIMGGIGFPTLWAVVRHVRCRCGIGRGPRTALLTAALLLIAGTLTLYASGMSLADAAFHSASARTAGFSTADLGSASPSSLILLMILMVIGASSGSTGGGIKTSTLTVLLAPPRFSRSLVAKARTILIFATSVIAVATLLLIALEPGLPWLALAFESTSAFGTVGLSTGVSSELSASGKTVVMVTMLGGRLGPLALCFLLFRDIPEGGELALG